jgi:hypothetical protein
MATTSIIGNGIPELIAIHEFPPFRLLKRPPSEPAYTVAGARESTARERTAPAKENGVVLQRPPPSVVLKTLPSKVPR